MKKTHKKVKIVSIILIGALLIALVALAFVIRTGRISPFAAGGNTRLYLNSTATTYNKGDTITTDIVFDADGEMIEAIDARLTYDPTFLSIQDADTATQGTQIKAGNILPQIASNTVDTAAGKISFSVGSNWVGSGFNSNGVLATITFTALKSGSSKVDFNFTPGAGSSSHAWAISGSTAVDKLAAATGLTFTLSDSSQPPDNPPRPKPPAPDNPEPTPVPPAETPAQPTPEATPDQSQFEPTPTYDYGTPTPASQPTNSQTITQPYFKTVSYTDSAVLESDQKRAKGIKITGTAHPSSKVTVTVLSSPLTAQANCDASGNFSVVINDWVTDGTHTLKGIAEKDNLKSAETVFYFTLSSGGRNQIALGKNLPRFTPASSVAPTEPTGTTPKNNRSKIIIWVLIILGVVIAGVVIYVFIDNRKKIAKGNNLEMPE